MSDALPLLAKAREVRVLTVVGEKPGARAGLGEDAARLLKTHGVEAVVDEVAPDGRRVGQFLEDYVEKCGRGLLVMGAYGRSRVREFILGGATEHMLGHLAAPVLLSH
jgi:nucleotide-binding universal stress UspA family protein